MAELARGLGSEPVVEPDLSRALDEARAWAAPEDAVCVCGSLYLVGDAMSAIGLEPFQRPV